MNNIFLIEDNEMNRDMLSRRLQRHGYNVDVAINGKEGIEKITKNSLPDLIIMDLSLPEMDGWETTQWLKQNNDTKHIPIIVLTAHALKSDREGALKVGCDDFDVKPVEFPRLLAKIEAQLNKESPE